MQEETKVVNKKSDQTHSFIHYIIDICYRDKGAAAALRRADNPNTEYQSWEVLARFQIDLENINQRLSYATIAAAVAKAKITQNGSCGIGKAIANCYEDNSSSDQAKAKLRRLLACDSTDEVCRILRPLFSLINSKSSLSLDFSKLLKQLLQFSYYPLDIKSQWAQEFYSRSSHIDVDQEGNAGGKL